MPEREMPKEVAYRMIKDDLSLDGVPTLNLASFVTTYMGRSDLATPAQSFSFLGPCADANILTTNCAEDEAEKLMNEAMSKNFIDYEEYPVSADIQNRCVSMIARLFNCPMEDDANVMGTSTIGSSEAIMLATLVSFPSRKTVPAFDVS